MTRILEAPNTMFFHSQRQESPILNKYERMCFYGQLLILVDISCGFLSKERFLPVEEFPWKFPRINKTQELK